MSEPIDQTPTEPAPTCVVTLIRQPNGGGVVVLIAKPEEGVEREATRNDVVAMCREIIDFEMARLHGEQNLAAIARAQQATQDAAAVGAVNAALNGKGKGRILPGLFGRRG